MQSPSVEPRESARSSSRARDIFVNRNLHLGRVQWIGFDLDYTLACYDKDAIEETAFEETVTKLVEDKGYPRQILDLKYTPDRVIRGLVVDKERGNILKLDRFAYVKLAHHGLKPLPRAQRKQLYSLRKLGGYGSPKLMALDTLFAMPEACLFAELVELRDQSPSIFPPTYAQIHNDIREMIDKAHRDGTLKRRIREDMDRFFNEDSDLPWTLDALRQSGKKLFLLTNSYWDYSDAVLTHLLDHRLPNHDRWVSYFDSIIVGARKPTFFTGDAPFLSVDPRTGLLSNVDADDLRLGQVYQGGNARTLQSLLDAPGEQVLYFGDHIYGDILRSKKSSGWRTGLVIEELEPEVETLAAESQRMREMEEVDRARRDLEEQRDALQLGRARGQVDTADAADIDQKIEALQKHSAHLYRAIQRAFNTHWGELFRAGKDVSLFGHQVADYACIYTSRVSNFLNYPADKYFRAHRGRTPHDPPPGDSSDGHG